MLEEAVSEAYLYPLEFPGFVADVHSHGDGHCVQGSVICSPPGTVEFYPTGRSSAAAAKGCVREALRDFKNMVTGLWSGGRAARSLGFVVEYGGSTNTLGVLLSAIDDPAGTQYRIRNRRIQQVTWLESDARVVETIQQVFRVGDAGVVPAVRSVSYSSASDQRLSRVETVFDTYQRVDRFPVPTHRRTFVTASERVRVREVHLSRVELLTVPEPWSEDRGSPSTP